MASPHDRKVTSLTLDDFINITVGEIVDLLPSLGYDTARLMVENWFLDNQWIPEDADFPQGEGEPEGGETPAEAAQEIADTSIADVRLLNIEVPVVLRLSAVGNFPSTSSDEEIINDLEAHVETAIYNAIRPDENIRIIDIAWDEAETEISPSGLLDQTRQNAIYNELETYFNLTDPCAVAIYHLRSIQKLDKTWMVDRFYTRNNRDDSPISFRVVKYTDSTFATKDNLYPYQYYVRLSKDLRLQTISQEPTE